MNRTEMPVHLHSGNFYLSIDIQQDILDGICVLLSFIEGLEWNDQRKIPGSIELSVLYGMLYEAVKKHQRDEK